MKEQDHPLSYLDDQLDPSVKFSKDFSTIMVNMSIRDRLKMEKSCIQNGETFEGRIARYVESALMQIEMRLIVENINTAEGKKYSDFSIPGPFKKPFENKTPYIFVGIPTSPVSLNTYPHGIER